MRRIGPRFHKFLLPQTNLTFLQSSRRGVGLAQAFTRFYYPKQTLHFCSRHSVLDWPEISHIFTTSNKPYIFAVITSRWIGPQQPKLIPAQYTLSVAIPHSIFLHVV